MFSYFSVNLKCENGKHACQLRNQEGAISQKQLSHLDIKTLIQHLQENISECKIINPPTVENHLKQVEVMDASPKKIDDLIKYFFPNHR